MFHDSMPLILPTSRLAADSSPVLPRRRTSASKLHNTLLQITEKDWDALDPTCEDFMPVRPVRRGSVTMTSSGKDLVPERPSRKSSFHAAIKVKMASVQKVTTTARGA
jgi:hypothetical protein